LLQATLGLPGGPFLTAVEQEILAFDPQLNLTGLTYGELITDFNSIFTSFATWYNRFFGPDGLIHISQE